MSGRCRGWKRPAPLPHAAPRCSRPTASPATAPTARACASSAPNLTDAIWLYGGSRDAIGSTLTNAHAGVMPAWGAKLDPVTIKMLAAYVHSLGGGEDFAPAAPVAAASSAPAPMATPAAEASANAER